MKKIYFLTLIIALSACAPIVQETYAPDGSKAYTLKCLTGPDECFKAAGDQCGTNGYNVLDRSYLGTQTTLLIACKSHKSEK